MKCMDNPEILRTGLSILLKNKQECTKYLYLRQYKTIKDNSFRNACKIFNLNKILEFIGSLMMYFIWSMHVIIKKVNTGNFFVLLNLIVSYMSFDYDCFVLCILWWGRIFLWFYDNSMYVYRVCICYLFL